ncbi:loganic acid O-methyltransferase-like [Hevea brasiliensis]|uniref:loganic acid O-methyltransferase-like n=1 Tax=Hevea brasiliensis TaxID=3981 RepID=UPI0025CC3DA8|nr:loganic acid O-methyltransferase-like [Hevea brasiliensis]
MMQSGNFSKAYPMKGGHGLHSYSNNSTHQRGAIDAVKEVINEAIIEKLDINILSLPNKTFQIADMGCSTGPNTFIAIQNIVEVIENKYQCQLEFQVFFNDHVSNDFNTLFSSLPLNKQYYPMGVPGSFHGRLFPNASLHIVHSSYALEWLSQVPKEVMDKSSAAWNKGKIYYSSAGDETIKAYTEQFGKDMDCFLKCRAKEVLPGGLILLSFPGRLSETPHSQVFSNIAYDLLGSCLVEMANKGIISEEKVDTFNIPIYFTSPQEVEAAVERNGCFSVERVICIPQKKTQDSISTKAKAISSHMRAGMEALLKEHFGDEIMDQLFDNFLQQLHKSHAFQFGVAFTVFLVLKRNEIY